MSDRPEPKPVFKFGSTRCPEKVWPVLTTPDSTRQFLFGIGLESTWELGSTLTGWLAETAVVSGEVLFAEFPNRLSYVLAAGPEQPEVYVTWEVQPCGTGAIVWLHVDEPDTSEDVVETSWQPVVTALQALLSADPL
jgi:uncharacterized protein YndB with AHSA1/START domain